MKGLQEIQACGSQPGIIRSEEKLHIVPFGVLLSVRRSLKKSTLKAPWYLKMIPLKIRKKHKFTGFGLQLVTR